MPDDTPKGPASSAEPMVPKSRLDELIAQRNEEREKAMFYQGQLTAMQSQRQAQTRPEADEPDMEELKQSNPTLYKRLKKNEFDLKQVRAGFSSVMDQNDRLAFLHEAGSEGKKRLEQVERILRHERESNRNFNVTRIGIFNYLKGQEYLAKEQAAQNAPAPKAPRGQEEVDDSPPTDPKFATTLKAGTATSSQVEKTREERIRDLENVEF